MKMRFSLLALCAGLSCTSSVFADDRIASPSADLVSAYAYTKIAPSASTRALSVASDGSAAAYVVQVPVTQEASRSQAYLATGAPTFVAEGARIMLINLKSRVSSRVCPGEGNDWDPVFSPDGRQLAFYSDRDGEARLWLHDRSSGVCRRLSDRPAKSMPWAHEEPRWSPDGTLVYFSAWPEDGPGSPKLARRPDVPNSAPEVPVGTVTVYRHAPGKIGAERAAAAGQGSEFDQRCGSGGALASSLAVATVDAAPESALLVDADVQAAPDMADRHYPTPYFRLSQSGKWLTYYDTPCRMGESPTQTRRLFAVASKGGTPILIADRLRSAVGGAEHILGYRWSPTADEIVFARGGEIWRVPFGEGRPEAPQRLGASLGPLSAALHWYTADGAMLLVGTNPVQAGRANSPFAYDIDLAMVPVDGSDPVRIKVDRKKWAIEGAVTRDDRSLLQPDASSFRLFGRDKTTGEAVILTFDWRSGQTQVTWRGRGRFDDLKASGRNGLVGIYEDFRTPANLFSYSPSLEAATRLTDVSPQQRAAASGQLETFETVIPQHDGTLKTVRTAVILPPGAKRGDRLPAVVWFYPGRDATNNLAQFGAPAIGDPAYLLTSRGYAVVLTNVAIGPGEQRGHVIDEIMDALMPQVHRAADLGYVDINRLAIRGQSFGGFATAAIVSRTNLFRAAIPSSGKYDLGGGYGDINFIRGIPVDNRDWSENSQPRLGQSPWDDPLRYIQNSPYYLADRIRTPVLILQGTDDYTGSRESGKLFSALRRLDRPVELALYQGGGHSPAHWPLAQAVDQMARTIEFLQRHIGPGWTPGQGKPANSQP